MNAGAFNLGAGLSFRGSLYAVMDAFAMNGAQVGDPAAMIASAVLLGAALLVSLFIPKPSDADNSEAV